MKLVIDADKLLQEGRIDKQQHEWLNGLAAQETGSLAFNILIGFGVIATAGGLLALVPTGATALVLGFALALGGLAVLNFHGKEWGVLGSILLLVGSLAAAGAIVHLTEGSVPGFLGVTLLTLAGAVVARSGLLAVLSMLALSASIGAATAYMHASYWLCIRQPLLTIVLFSAIALVTFLLSKRLSAAYERITVIMARTSIFLVNFGFWIGSLWGDPLDFNNERWESYSAGGPTIPAGAFVIAWTFALVGIILWAMRANRPWVVNTCAVFAAIHFYTQFFERLDLNPISVLLAGLIALGIAVAIVAYNKKRVRDAGAVSF